MSIIENQVLTEAGFEQVKSSLIAEIKKNRSKYVFNETDAKRALENIDDCATDYLKLAAAAIREAMENYDEKTLSFYGETFHEEMEEIIRQIEQGISTVNEYTDAVRERMPIVKAAQEKEMQKEIDKVNSMKYSEYKAKAAPPVQIMKPTQTNAIPVVYDPLYTNLK